MENAHLQRVCHHSHGGTGSLSDQCPTLHFWLRLGSSYSLVVEGSFPAIRLKASSAALRTSRSLLRAATSNLGMAALAFDPCWPRAGMAISFTVSSPQMTASERTDMTNSISRLVRPRIAAART